MPIDVECPYGERWSGMAPEDGGRRCGRCDRHLVDLSLLTRAQAERFAARVEGRVCARVAVDASGRPVHARRAVRRLVSTAAGVMLSVSVAACGTGRSDEAPPADERAEAERLADDGEDERRARARALAEAERRRAEAEQRRREEAAREPRSGSYDDRVGIVLPRGE